MIDEAGEGINFYRMMISPDPETEDAKKTADLWTVTQQTIRKLEKRLGVPLQFVAAEHNDQTEIRHIHSIVLIPGKLNVADFQAMRQAVSEALSPQPEPEQEQAVPVWRGKTRVLLPPQGYSVLTDRPNMMYVEAGLATIPCR